MTMETRTFDVADVITMVSGCLVSPIGNLYAIASFLVGRDVYTHELAMKELWAQCREAIVAQHPEFANVTGDGCTKENWQEWLAETRKPLASEYELAPLGWNRIADMHPLETLQELAPDKPIIAVALGDADA